MIFNQLSKWSEVVVFIRLERNYSCYANANIVKLNILSYFYRTDYIHTNWQYSLFNVSRSVISSPKCSGDCTNANLSTLLIIPPNSFTSGC